MAPLFSDVTEVRTTTELRFELLRAMKIHIVVFWVIIPGSLVNGYSVSAVYTSICRIKTRRQYRPIL
jgi:hypothetical protein